MACRGKTCKLKRIREQEAAAKRKQAEAQRAAQQAQRNAELEKQRLQKLDEQKKALQKQDEPKKEEAPAPKETAQAPKEQPVDTPKEQPAAKETQAPEASKPAETAAPIEGPLIGPNDAQRLYNATVKTINELINQPASASRDARLKQMRSFRDKLKSSFPDVIKEPDARTLRGTPVHPNDVRGNVDLYRFPNEGKKTIDAPVESTSPEGATKPVAEGAKPQPEPTSPTANQPRSETRSTASRGPLQGTRTLARPGTDKIQDISMTLPEIQKYRRQLAAEEIRRVMELERKLSPEQEKKTRAERDQFNRAYRNAYAIERQFYDAGKGDKPDDWEGVAPKPMTREQVNAQPRLAYEKIPEALREVDAGSEKFAREPGPKRAERYKGQKFVNNEIRKNVNNIGDWRSQIAGLDEVKDKSRITELNDKINKAKDKLKYFYELREFEAQKEGGTPETNLLTREYNDLAQKMKSFLTPEQQEAIRKGETIDINRIPQKREFLQALRELGRERDRITQGMNDELQYVNAAPGNSIKSWREMDPEDRAYESNEIRKAAFMQKVESELPGYFKQKTGKSEEEYYNLPPQAQDAWKKRYSSDLIKSGSPGINGADVYKWMLGGGTQFYSKYPPELQQPMIRSARKGFKEMAESTQMLKDQLKMDPFSRILGERAGGALNQLMFGAPGNYFTTPPQPYEYPLNQPQQGSMPQGPMGGPSGGQQQQMPIEPEMQQPQQPQMAPQQPPLNQVLQPEMQQPQQQAPQQQIPENLQGRSAFDLLKQLLRR